MPLSESPDRQAWREFGETKCAVCGGTKPPKNSFCRACYFKLEEPMRKALYRRFGSGYEESYIEAKEWLLQERRAAR